MDSDISIVESSKEKYSNYEVNFTDTSDLSEDVISARNRGKFGRFIDTFKPAATVDIDTTGLTEEEAYHLRMSSAPMSPELSPLQMFAIAVGGSL